MQEISKSQSILKDVHEAIILGIGKDLENTTLNSDRIDKKIVHKKIIENVIISHPIELDKEKNVYRTKVIVDPTHKFFFDHELSHLPGMLLIEAVRQFGTALSHLFFNAPFDSQFILHEVSSKFIGGADIKYETFIDGIFTDIVMKKGKPRKLSGTAYIHQNGQIIGSIASSWLIIPNKVLTHLTKFH